MKNSKIYKVAGLSFLGFCALSVGVDKANIGPVATQVAGFCGAFLGALAAQKKRSKISSQPQKNLPETNKNSSAEIVQHNSLSHQNETMMEGAIHEQEDSDASRGFR